MGFFLWAEPTDRVQARGYLHVANMDGDDDSERKAALEEAKESNEAYQV